MSYYPEDVNSAERQICDAKCPGVDIERGDYGRALYVRRGEHVWTIFRPCRSERGDEVEIALTPERIDALIKEWKNGA